MSTGPFYCRLKMETFSDIDNLRSPCTLKSMLWGRCIQNRARGDSQSQECDTGARDYNTLMIRLYENSVQR